MRYRGSPVKTKAEERETFIDKSLHLSIVKATSRVLLSKCFPRSRKSNMKFRFHHLSSSWNLTCTLKSVCEWATYQMTALLLGKFISWIRAVWELQQASYGLKIVPSYATRSLFDFYSFQFENYKSVCYVNMATATCTNWKAWVRYRYKSLAHVGNIRESKDHHAMSRSSEPDNIRQNFILEAKKDSFVGKWKFRR